MLKICCKTGISEAGCDEAGRGCLAGPVYAGSVILPENFNDPELNDSKLLTAEQRERLRIIIEKSALAWSIGIATVEEIDEINILNASFLAMHRAIQALKMIPEYLIIDGNRFKAFPGIPHECIIQGDCLYQSIAAASVLAKTYRDDFMRKLHPEFPEYSWNTNKGYATLAHREAIKKYGANIWHRKSFKLFEEQLEIEFEFRT
jgi:ribonuclease HII